MAIDDTIKLTRIRLSAYTAEVYLAGLRSQVCDLLNDIEFVKRLNALQAYIDLLLETNEDGDIVDEYIVVEQREVKENVRKYDSTETQIRHIGLS